MLATAFDTDKLENEKKEIENKLTKEEVYTNLELSISLSKRNLALQKTLEEVNDARNLYETLCGLYDLFDGQVPAEDLNSFNSSLNDLENKVNKLLSKRTRTDRDQTTFSLVMFLSHFLLL